jgi:uncharacterized membrane protein
MMEKVALLRDPTFQPSCNMNPVLSCGAIISTPQASAFGFPNPVIGFVGFTVVITAGMALLAGAKLKRWFWLGLQAGTIFGLLFVKWLVHQSLYKIGALCIYCIIVWIVTAAIFWYTLLLNLQNKSIKTPAWLESTISFASGHHLDILVGWYVLVAILISVRFWYYWQTLIP